MKISKITATLSAVLAGTMFIPAASACVSGPSQPSSALQQLLPDAQKPLSLATPAQLARDQSKESSPTGPSIVGMWSFQFISQGNTTRTPPIADGTMINFGYTQWHSDGTEFFTSGARSPGQGNFCLGVWEPTGLLTFQLNHFALNYDATTGTLLGTIVVVEKVTLSPGGTQYSGTFAETVFDTKGNKTDSLTGQVTAQRVTVDRVTP
jgi:hypothetical protein